MCGLALTSWFPNEEVCASYLARLRWPDGFRCPQCGCPEAWQTVAGLWLCRSCRRKTSVIAGTIFHRSRLPLTDWFAAVWFVTSQKNGVSALGLLFYRLLQQAVATDPHPYRKLTVSSGRDAYPWS